jgi:hypothetical protein
MTDVSDPERDHVPIDPALRDELEALADHCEMDLVEVVDAAARAHLRVMVGDRRDGPVGREFQKVGSDRQAQAVLRQDGELEFYQLEPFRYADDKGRAWDVPVAKTDLASVPPMMTWFVPRYGRHTLPALLHDFLQDPAHGVSSWDADEVFRDSMRATGVPFARRWAMWAAVATRSLVKKQERAWPWWILVVVWAIGYGGLVGLVGWPWLLWDAADHHAGLAVAAVVMILLTAAAAILQDRPPRERDGREVPAPLVRPARAVFPFLAGGVIGLAVAIAVVLALRGRWVVAVQLGLVVSPVVTSLLWWRRGRATYLVGLIAGVAFSLLAVPALLVGWALLVYRAAEAFAGLFKRQANPVSQAEWQARIATKGSVAAAAPPPAPASSSRG